MGIQRSILPSKLQCSGAKFQPLHSSTTALPPCTPPAPDIPLHPRASLLEQGCPALASCHLVIKERRTWLSSRFFSSPQPEHTALVHRAGRGKTVKHWYFQHQNRQCKKNTTPITEHPLKWPSGCSYCYLQTSKTIQEYRRRLVYKIKIIAPNFSGFVSPERCYCPALGISLPHFYRKVQQPIKH